MPFECPHCGYIAEAMGFVSCPGCGCKVRQEYRPLSKVSSYKGLFLGVGAEAEEGSTDGTQRGIIRRHVQLVDSELARLVGMWYLVMEPEDQETLDLTVYAFSSALAEEGLHPYSPRCAALILRRIWAIVAGKLTTGIYEPLCINCTFSVGEGACEVKDLKDNGRPVEGNMLQMGDSASCALFTNLVDCENLKLRLRYWMNHRCTE